MTPLGTIAGTALVTGGARGLGAAISRRLADLGGSVVVADVLADQGRGVVEEITADGGQARFVELDVRHEDAWAAVIGGIDGLAVLVNNAGVGEFGRTVESETLAGWEQMIAVNQTGVWLGMRAAAPALRQHGAGSIVNMSSVFGAVGGFGETIAYHASKGAIRAMTKNAAVHWARDGIRVNSVHPGFISTAMVSTGLDAEHEEVILRSTPMGRLGRPEEVADVVAFLASDASSYMPGSEVYVDGGWTAL